MVSGAVALRFYVIALIYNIYIIAGMERTANVPNILAAPSLYA